MEQTDYIETRLTLVHDAFKSLTIGEGNITNKHQIKQNMDKLAELEEDLRLLNLLKPTEKWVNELCHPYSGITKLFERFGYSVTRVRRMREGKFLNELKIERHQPYVPASDNYVLRERLLEDIEFNLKKLNETIEQLKRLP